MVGGGIAKKRRASSSRVLAREADTADETCCVCLEDYGPESRRFFPCMHWVCTACFEKIELCPCCRMDKEGQSEQERVAAAHNAAPQVAARLRERSRVIAGAVFRVIIIPEDSL